MDHPPQLIGLSDATRAIEEEITCAARTDAKVLITGESGVGKEVVARLIHQRSRRHRAALISINCAGIPDSLLASELFGHSRGSFTDAYRDKRGWLEESHGGTVFLDEIGEMSAQMQSMLLRFLENGEIQRVGSDRQKTVVDVRVIAATNKRLLERVAAHEFREDLFYRLNVIHIDIPPLRQRREDVLSIMEFFLKELAIARGTTAPRLSEEAVRQLQAFDWPGNVRQLRNVAERLTLRSGNGVIARADLPREILSLGSHSLGENPGLPSSRSNAATMFERLVRHGESFWTVVHDPFIARDVTRDELRIVVREALALSHGSYKGVVQLFNLPPSDHKKLLNFLRKFDCHLPIHEFRTAAARLPAEPARSPEPVVVNQ